MPDPEDAAWKQAKLERIMFKEYFPVKFRGDGRQNPDAHVLLFKKLCTELKYVATNDEVEKLELIRALFFRTVTEKALIWYDSGTFTSLADITTKFLRHYSGSHGVSGDLTLFNTLCWSQGETALEFKGRLKSLADRLELPEHLLKHRFIHGLPDSVKTSLLPFMVRS